MPTIQEEIGEIEEPDLKTKEKMDKEYKVWKIKKAQNFIPRI